MAEATTYGFLWMPDGLGVIDHSVVGAESRRSQNWLSLSAPFVRDSDSDQRWLLYRAGAENMNWRAMIPFEAECQREMDPDRGLS